MKHDQINMEHADEIGTTILRLLTMAAVKEVPSRDNKAKAMYAMTSCLVRGMQAVSSLVGWPGSNFGPDDNRDHLTMYDYINDESKTFAALVVARTSKENEQTTCITCSPGVLAEALHQTEMIYGDLEGKIDPAIIGAVRDWDRMSPAERRALMAPLTGSMN
jgi:hypothetical protein